MLWLSTDIEGKGRDVGDCTSMAVRHHGAQWASPLRSERRRGEADEVLGGRRRVLRVGEMECTGH
jgi:hypothetical protein